MCTTVMRKQRDSQICVGWLYSFVTYVCLFIIGLFSIFCVSFAVVLLDLIVLTLVS